MKLLVVCRSRIVLLLVLLVTYCAPAGLSGTTIVAGDKVEADFTIRLPDSSLLLTTRPTVAEADGQVKSTVYMALKHIGPVTLTAGPLANAPAMPVDRGFEGELLDQLGRAIVGWKAGETRTVVLKSAVTPGLPDGERFLRLSRVRHRGRTARMQRSQYVATYQREPQVGDRIAFEPPIEAIVKGMDDEFVEVQALSPDGTVIKTDFGPGTIKDHGDKGYEIVLTAKPGTLIRTNQLLGRIVETDKRRFTIDYGDLFGGQTLTCELTVNRIVP